MIELISARNLRFAANGGVSMIAQFNHIAEEIPFTAVPTDVEEHGRIIHAKALNGDYGEIAPYIPPTELELATRDNPRRVKREMAKAKSQVEHYTLLGDTSLAEDWRQHYIALHSLTLTEDWPIVSNWPTM